MSTTTFLTDEFDRLGAQLGFDAWGVTPLLRPISLAFYKSWLERQYHGEMSYLVRHLPQKENPKLLDSRLESAVVFAFPYVPHPRPQPVDPVNGKTPLPKALRTAAYAQGEDYHHWLKESLEVVAQHLRSLYPEETFVCATDSSPILERDLAHRAGLGWIAKNTCVLDRKRGSLFLIGEILTSCRFEAKAQLPMDFCGTCTRCLDICPTGALEEPRLLNAQKCISYWTIESRQVPPRELREAMGDWFFGCDLCQNVCPWNRKVVSAGLETTRLRSLDDKARSDLLKELEDILTLSGKKLQKRFAGTPFHRAGPFGLRRNALVVAANQNLSELRDAVSLWTSDLKLGELAQWTLNQLKSPAVD